MADSLKPVRVLVCGGRDFDDGELVRRALDALYLLRPFAVLIEGGATGADSLARTWAMHRGIPVITEKADWKAHGRGAGPRRNQRMLDEHAPDVVVAFSGGVGTADMIRRARSVRIPVIDFSFASDSVGSSSSQPGEPAK